MISLDQLSFNTARLQTRVRDAVVAAGRTPGSVRVLVATKTQSPAQIAAVLSVLPDDADIPQLLGENRVQEITLKSAYLSSLVSTNQAELHYIGQLQRNKINQLLSAPVSCIQTVDSWELAQAISDRCGNAKQYDSATQNDNANRVMQVMVQVNTSGEPNKGGCAPADAIALAIEIAKLPGLQLRGFMCVGVRPIELNSNTNSNSSINIVNSEEIRANYRQLREIRDAVVNSGAPGTAQAHQLSMGMSADLELAIAEGATIIRIGSAIFGPRNPAQI